MALVDLGLAESRSAAAALIDAGQVLVSGSPAMKASRLVGAGEPVRLSGETPRYVSRGGEKLGAALERFGLQAAGKHVLDAGSSTGGFTDCLLQGGAERVVAVDVGRGQLHPRIRSDPRVTSLERTDIRSEKLDVYRGRMGLVVADLSFIALRSVAPALVGFAAPGADIVALVKPQFEAGRVEVSRTRGVVRSPAVWRSTLESATGSVRLAGAVMMNVMVSPLRGAAGNVEFLAHFRAPGCGASDFRITGTEPGESGVSGAPGEYGESGESGACGTRVAEMLDRVVEQAARAAQGSAGERSPDGARGGT